MTGVTTEELMHIAMEMAGQTDWPADSMIHVPGKDIKKIIFGIDMGVAEITLGKQLGYDLVLAHHPDARVVTFPDVLDLHTNIMVKNGIPAKVAEEVVAKFKDGIAATRHSANYDHAPSFARLLGIPYMNIHNPLDEIGRRIMQEAVDAKLRPDSTVADVVAALNTVPEIGNAPTKVAVRLGNLSNLAGKTVVVHGAGTNGGAALARVYYQHGTDTVIYIHCAPAEVTRLRQEFPVGKNLVVSGHIASDVAGINPFIERLESVGLTVTRVSGL